MCVSAFSTYDISLLPRARNFNVLFLFAGTDKGNSQGACKIRVMFHIFYTALVTCIFCKMEEDLELYNDNGLDGFGQMLGCALKSSLHFSNTTDTDADSSFFPLQLTYR